MRNFSASENNIAIVMKMTEGKMLDKAKEV